VGVVDNVVELYGVRRILADIDAGRDFSDSGEHLVSAALNWVAGEGFQEFFYRHDPEWRWESILEFRNRHIVKALKSIGLNPWQ